MDTTSPVLEVCSSIARVSAARIDDFEFSASLPHNQCDGVRRAKYLANTLTVFSPLMIPESKFFNVLRSQEVPPNFIAPELPEQSVLKSVHLDRQPRKRTIKIQKILSDWMLTAKLESRESTSS
jgi:hypothetical protein